jgi:hypothetical protein
MRNSSWVAGKDISSIPISKLKRLFGIKWGCFATERTETFEKKLKNSFSL